MQQLTQDAMDMERDYDELFEEEKRKVVEKQEKAENIRKRCLKTMKETKEREGKKRKKDSHRYEDILEYLDKRREEKRLKEEKELELRERELEQKDKLLSTLQDVLESQKSMIQALLMKEREK